MKILVTGGAGFIGSAVVRQAIQNRGYDVVNVDSLTYAANQDNLTDIADHAGYVFEQADIRDEAAMTALLGAEPIGHLLDIGTGTGRMIELFGPSAEQVTALDRSSDMLRLARAKLPEDAGDKYALVLGDFSALPLEPGSADTVVLHQVLHYAQAPEAVIEEAARVTAAGGRVLIADFAAHEREELRLRDQHARLGFSDGQIESWFADAGLELERVEVLPGQELTVQLWLGRRRGARVLPIEGRLSA